MSALVDLDDRRLARLALSTVVEPGDPRLLRHLGGGVRPLLEACVGRGPLAERVPDVWRTTPADVDAAVTEAVAAAERVAMRWVCPGDDDWPSGLDDLATVEPLNGATGPPLGLWVRGPVDLADVLRSSVSVVGSRAATTYGTHLAAEIAAETAAAGLAVVSGGAFGIDVAAHRGVLAAGRTTVAVLACGADHLYPRSHAGVLARIADTGAVVSEHAPGRTPTKGRFLTRNRLIAALTSGTVVVEAGRRSGALNTLNWALRLGRVAMCVPGPVTSETSAGTHQALREGGAVLVTDADEVREAVGPVGEVDATRAWSAPRDHERLTVPARAVFEELHVERPSTAGDLARRVPCGEAEAATVLTSLGELGFAEHGPDGWTAVPPSRRRSEVGDGAQA